MNLAIKRRTIGVIILLIIFFWIGVMLYRQHKNTTISNKLLVPEQPKVPVKVLNEFDILKSQVSVKKTEVPSVQPSPVTKTPVTTNKLQTFSKVKLPAAWVIQLATFSNKKNAQSLLSDVRHQGYDAYSQDVTVKGKKFTKVFVGPNISYKAVERAQKDFETRYHLHGVIQTYHVNLTS